MIPVTKIQRFCTKDGPGIRTVVFLKGCPLRCAWCHNPEGQSAQPSLFYSRRLCVGCGACAAACPQGAHAVTATEHLFHRTRCIGCMACASVCPTGALEVSGRPYTGEELLRAIRRDAVFYGDTGGVTFSGGEPTVHTAELLPLMRRLKAAGIHTAVETCGYAPREAVEQLIPVTDLFLWDVKDTDDARHRANTGVSHQPILENLRLADERGATTILRCILLRGINLNEAHLRQVTALYHSLRHCAGVELIPYHTYGATKREQLGWDSDPHEEWIPVKEELAQADTFLRAFVPVIRN